MKFSSIIIIFILFQDQAIAQTKNQSIKASNKADISEITKSKLLLELKSLMAKPVSTIEAEIQDFNKKTLYYVQQRDKECKGEFSSIEINDKGEGQVVKRKLSKSERNLCLIDLVNFRKTYIDEIFNLRKKILKASHSQQIKDLEKMRKDSLKKMDDLVSDLTK